MGCCTACRYGMVLVSGACSVCHGGQVGVLALCGMFGFLVWHMVRAGPQCSLSSRAQCSWIQLADALPLQSSFLSHFKALGLHT